MPRPRLFVLLLTLGLAGCVADDDEPLPPSDPQADGTVPPDDDPPGDNVPGPADETCGGAQLKADGACVP